MPNCRSCGMPFDWGYCDDKWVLLEPTDSHDDLPRTFVDENGELRADHRDRHPGGPTVNVTRLDRKVQVEEVEEEAKPHKIAAAAARLIGRRDG